MNEVDVRMECLRLAHDGADKSCRVLARADEYAKYVANGEITSPQESVSDMTQSPHVGNPAV